jgi:hypothetical protein
LHESVKEARCVRDGEKNPEGAQDRHQKLPPQLQQKPRISITWQQSQCFIITDQSHARARFFFHFPSGNSTASDFLWKTPTDTYASYQGNCYEIRGTITDLSSYNNRLADACKFTRR